MHIVADDPAFVGTLTTAVSPLLTPLLTVAGAGLTIGVGILGLRKGWGLIRKFF